MMHGKSPRSDVEMTKNLNFVKTILDFWQAFLNQFWPNLVHTYKIHFWISFVLCVVFKCQYFWSYSRKTHFLPFIYIFQRAVTHSKIVRFTRFFFYGFRTFQLSFFLFFESYHFLKIMKRKFQKLNFVTAKLYFWRPSWLDNWEFLTLYSIYDNDHL